MLKKLLAIGLCFHWSLQYNFFNSKVDVNVLVNSRTRGHVVKRNPMQTNFPCCFSFSSTLHKGSIKFPCTA